MVILLLKDDPDAFSGQVGELLEFGEKYDYKYLLGYGKRLAALGSYRRHDLDDALEQIEDSTRDLEEVGNRALANSNRLYHCLWRCGREKPAGLLDEAGRALRFLTARPPGMCLREIDLSVFGALAREAGDYDLAEKNLTAAVRKSRAEGARQILAGACLHLAKLYYDTGDWVRGENCLHQALDLAEENGYLMFWDLHFPTLVEMAGRCFKSGIHPDYARTLIARHFGSEAAGWLAGQAAHATDHRLRELAGSFLSRYGGTTSGGSGAAASGPAESPAKEIRVNLFGKFQIAVGGAAIPESAWKTRKITGVLKCLVAHRGRAVSRDRLIEIFWPGGDPRSGAMSLRAALYELKKVLREYGAANLLDEKRGSLEARPGVMVVDVDDFRVLAWELKQLPADAGAGERRNTILEEMIALYRGDFLEEELYEDWTFVEREELRSLYFGVVIKLADNYAADGDSGKAEKLLLDTLARDQYNEDVCLRLLRLYIANNQRWRAARLYAGFAGRFEKELGIKPDERLAAAVRSGKTGYSGVMEH